MNKTVRSQLRLFLTGLLAILPLFITIVVVVWAGKLIWEFLGPDSFVGNLLASIGLQIVSSPTLAYLLGFFSIIFGIYGLGILVHSKLDRIFRPLIDHVVKRLPFIRSVYEMTDRFVGVFDHKEESDLKSMSPVWCSFGGDVGAKVLALMPNADAIMLNGREYFALLVPTAPVPVGGGLIFVPVEWVEPAGFGVETLTSIYVTMGAVAPPESSEKRG